MEEARQQVFTSYNRGEKNGGYTYCTRCGSHLASLAVGAIQRPTCPQCGWVHFKNPATGVAVLVVEGDQVLLGRRAQGHYAAGQWCLPGGFIEFDEDFLSASLREVYEETGLSVEIQSILNVVSNFLAPGLHTLVIVLLARVVQGAAAPGDDLSELRWHSLGCALPQMAFTADQYIVELYGKTKPPGLPVDSRYARWKDLA